MKEQKTQATKVNIKADENAKAASAIDSGSNFYGLTNDYMFKVIMQENVYVREMLIRALLGLDEEELTYSEVLNPIIPGYAIDNKTCILDLNLMLNNKEKLNLEMQVIKDQAWEKRSLYYWARNYADLKAGNNYAELKRTTHIGILDHTPVSEHPEFYSRYELRNIRSNRTYSDVIDIRTLDLTRVDLAYPEEYGIAYWAKIIKAA
ncbi:MAG: PD-(D/E)XK nuclease family transposase, partial [Eubacteriales bacterium]|nr:PD-(D/E)XK nuclease family transposase [Eubacteriales bacterium]